MPESIRSKIIIAVLIVFALLFSVITIFSVAFFKNSEELIISGYFNSVAVFAQKVGKEIAVLEDAAKDTAAFGEVYYNAKFAEKNAEYFLKNMFQKYDYALGGGIWFEPYTNNPVKERDCIYVFKNENDEIVRDYNFESPEYDYLHQNWYTELMGGYKKGMDVEWSKPYFESIGGKTLMVTVGTGIYHNGKLIGTSTVDRKLDSVIQSISEIKPTPGSFALFADKDNDFIIAYSELGFDNSELIGKSLSNIPWYKDDMKDAEFFKYNDKYYVPFVSNLKNGMILAVNIPKDELFKIMELHIAALFLILLIFGGFITFMLYLLLKRNVLVPISKLSDMANKIGDGDFDLKIKIDEPKEFAYLASTFDKMTADITTISQKKAKMENDLSLARTIQLSSLPNIFPPFPDKKEFDIFAGMNAAKAVGGDFYDFYFTGPETFMFLIADVSGKGVPAALFMMKVKTIIGNTAKTTCPPEVLAKAINNEICKNDKEGLFLTMIACIVNIFTGEIVFINCGHNSPLIQRANGDYEYMQLPSNIVLGAFKNAEYEIVYDKLNPGDRIFIYTDGITEAINKDEELYGEERLKNAINKYKSENLESLCEKVKSDIFDYSSGVEQSDDITMLVYQYNGSEKMEKTYKQKAEKKYYAEFYNWLKSNCEGLNEELSYNMEMCAEEIFANIVFYAYPDDKGDIEVNFIKNPDDITLRFTDSGIAYNPLEKPDPDITLPPEERPIGGLGIFLVKQLTSELVYERKDGKNILTAKFAL